MLQYSIFYYIMLLTARRRHGRATLRSACKESAEKHRNTKKQPGGRNFGVGVSCRLLARRLSPSK